MFKDTIPNNYLEVKPKKRRRCRDGSKKKANSIIYSYSGSDKSVRVCSYIHYHF